MTLSQSSDMTKRTWIDYFIEVPAVLVTFVMMFHITANAVARTFLNQPLPFTLELAQFWYLPIVAFLGFVAAQHRDQHIAADVLFEKMPRAARKYFLAVAFGFGALVCLGFAWFGGVAALDSFDIKQTAGSSGLVVWPMIFLPPLAFGILVVQYTLAVVRALRGAPIHSLEEAETVIAELDEDDSDIRPEEPQR